MRLFYDHLIIEIDDVYTEIEKLEIHDLEKKSLSKIIDQTIHHSVLNKILKHLDKNDHEKFLEAFQKSPHNRKHLKFLAKRIDSFEAKIQQTITKLKKNLLADLKAHSR